MDDTAFVIMQVGAEDSPERKRADEIYEFVVAPAVRNAGLKPHRADLDLTPGPITPKMLADLLSARVVIADLTGRNPNVFYELGITHSFVRPLVSTADSSKSLPFDAKDERVIEIGEYPASGLTFVQGRKASDALQDSLAIVLADGYDTPSPLRGVAANRSVDDLAPKDPVAAEITVMREAIEEIRAKMASARPSAVAAPPALPSLKKDLTVLRQVITVMAGYLDESDWDFLVSASASKEQVKWAHELRETTRAKIAAAAPGDPWLVDESDSGGYSDEPPF